MDITGCWAGKIGKRGELARPRSGRERTLLIGMVIGHEIAEASDVRLGTGAGLGARSSSQAERIDQCRRDKARFAH